MRILKGRAIVVGRGVHGKGWGLIQADSHAKGMRKNNEITDNKVIERQERKKWEGRGSKAGACTARPAPPGALCFGMRLGPGGPRGGGGG